MAATRTGLLVFFLTAFMLAVTPATSWPATVLVEDDFNDDSIDSSKWNVVTAGIPQNPKSAVEQNQQMELQGRAHLNTVQQFDPLTAPEDGLRIRGRWNFVSNDDFLQILTRTDGTPGGGYGETNNGVEFFVQMPGSGGNNMTIRPRGAATVTGVVNAGGLSPVAGETYDFDIRDNGDNMVFTMRQVGGTKQRTMTASSSWNPGTDLVSFHNRESGRRSNLDDVVIDSPTSNVPGFGTVLLQDNFNDNSLDGSKWNVVTAGIPQNPKSATETNQRIQLQGRAHLNTAQQFDPSAGNGLTVRGRWTFESGDDFMQILTRSDGTPGGGYGETNNGVEFFATETATTNNVLIRGRGGVGVGGGINSDLPISAGETYDFEIVDDGNNLALTLKQVGGPKAAVATAASGSTMATNLIAFHNRESGRMSHLDDVVIVDGTPTAGPNPGGIPGLFEVRDVKSTGTINNLATADALLAGTGVASETVGSYPTINFLDTGGNGLFGGDLAFPNDVAGDDNNFAVMATGLIFVPTAGDYIFGVNSDDGSRLRIDGQDVIVNDVLQGPHNIYGHTELAAGLHDLELVYFEAGGGAEVELFYFDGAGGRHLLAAASDVIPEPSTFLIWSLLAALGIFGWRRRR